MDCKQRSDGNKQRAGKNRLMQDDAFSRAALECCDEQKTIIWANKKKAELNAKSVAASLVLPTLILQVKNAVRSMTEFPVFYSRAVRKTEGRLRNTSSRNASCKTLCVTAIHKPQSPDLLLSEFNPINISFGLIICDM